MPIIEYKCDECHTRKETIHLSVSTSPSHYLPCQECNGLLVKQMSMPASIRMADMEKINRKRQRIKEPMWRDLKTGKLTPVNP